MIYHETPSGTLHQGEVLDILRTLPDESVNCCVTSPPYWGLRDYGTAEWEGGDPECDHKGEPMRTRAHVNQNCGTGNDVKNSENCQFHRDQCPKCGAIRKDQQLGLERTPEEYVARMVEIFREVRRVLRKDGTLWLNLGDSYAATRWSNTPGTGFQGEGSASNVRIIKETDLKPKDLVGIPWRVAFALQADGWYLRQDLIWHKPNPMPESVTDRCTKAHEYVFLMSKSAKYYYDSDAVKEPANYAGCGRGISKNISPDGITDFGGQIQYDTRNKRSVWTVTTKPFKEAHFATFPRDLIRPMIQAGCPAGGVVLDPFMGSGTTAIEAIYQGKRYIGIDLNPDYCAMAAKRIEVELDQQVIDL